MTYVSKHNLLLVGGSPYLSGEGVACGVSGWRLLDAPPYWGPRLGQQIEKVNNDFQCTKMDNFFESFKFSGDPGYCDKEC